ncbi:hypothetical protein ACE6H2_014636 [Prunus campanulata]
MSQPPACSAAPSSSGLPENKSKPFQIYKHLFSKNPKTSLPWRIFNSWLAWYLY